MVKRQADATFGKDGGHAWSGQRECRAQYELTKTSTVLLEAVDYGPWVGDGKWQSETTGCTAFSGIFRLLTAP